MNLINQFFDSSDKYYKSVINETKMFDWDNHVIIIKPTSFTNSKQTKYIKFQDLNNLIRIFDIHISDAKFANINCLFDYYHKELTDLKMLYCPSYINGQKYIDLYDINKIFMIDNPYAKKFYNKHIMIHSPIDNILEYVFNEEIEKIKENNVIIDKQVYNKLNNDLRRMHNINAQLLQRIKELESQNIFIE